MCIGQNILRVGNIDVAVMTQVMGMNRHDILLFQSDCQNGVVGKSPCQSDALEGCLVREKDEVKQSAFRILFVLGLFNVCVAEKIMVGIEQFCHFSLCIHGFSTAPCAVDGRTKAERRLEGTDVLERSDSVGIGDSRTDHKHIKAGKITECECLVGFYGRHLIIIIACKIVIGQVGCQVAIIHEPQVTLGADVLTHL